MTVEASPSPADFDFEADAIASARRPGVKCSVCVFLASLPPALEQKVRASLRNHRITDQNVVDTLTSPKYGYTDVPNADRWANHRRKHEQAAA